MNALTLTIRRATTGNLARVNTLIDSAIAIRDLPERVKRLSLPSYPYDEYDLAHADIVVAENNFGDLLGVAAWEPADASDSPNGHRALMLHGLYVEPGVHRQGIGTLLLEAAEQAARTREFDGLLVRVQPTAENFLIAKAFKRLLPEDPNRSYAHRFWKLLGSAADSGWSRQVETRHARR